MCQGFELPRIRKSISSQHFRVSPPVWHDTAVSAARGLVEARREWGALPDLGVWTSRRTTQTGRPETACDAEERPSVPAPLTRSAAPESRVTPAEARPDGFNLGPRSASARSTRCIAGPRPDESSGGRGRASVVSGPRRARGLPNRTTRSPRLQETDECVDDHPAPDDPSWEQAPSIGHHPTGDAAIVVVHGDDEIPATEPEGVFGRVIREPLGGE
jgi:hypothetical protein